jgi:acyl-CoA synthetase (AMP-forming)/AMP-acid ligase II
VTGANPAYTERELVGQLTDSGASVLVTVPALVPAARAAAAAAGVGEVIVLGEADGATPIAALLATDAPAPDPALDPGTAVALLDAGWLHTGDLGHVDQHGNVFVVDRLKELIKVSAHQVAPAELEALLAGHPAVADAAVIPRPDATHGEVPVAVVVPRGEVDADELIAWVAERVAPHKRVRAVRLVDAIPRTPSGKLLRRLLIDQTASGSEDLRYASYP